MRSKYITPIAITAAIASIILFGVSEHSNSQMRRQIKERDAYIERLDTLIGLYSHVEFMDSFTVLSFPVDQYGNKLKFDDLDSIRKVNERIIEVQDLIIREAKKKYKFNYSVKATGDTVLIVFWDK